MAATHDLWCLAALRPADAGAVERLRAAVSARARESLCAIATGSAVDVPGFRAELKAHYRDLVVLSTATDEDPYQAAFGIPAASPENAWRIPGTVRVLTAFHGRSDELDEVLDAVLGVFPVRPEHPFDAIQAAGALVNAPRQLNAVKAAVGVYRLVEQRMAVDPVGTATPLRELMWRVDRSAANNRSMNLTIRTLREAGEVGKEDEQAMVALDLYRKMVEGQLRPWAATLLRIRGRRLVRTPELATLRNQLLSDGHPLLISAAAPILSVARNAAAHEDYAWDDANQRLTIGDSTVTREELRTATDQVYSFMSGAESGWACARAASPELGRLLDSPGPETRPRTLDEHRAVAAFGGFGLHVKDYRHEHGEFVVDLDALPADQVAYCCEAILRASQYLADPVRITVTVRDGRQAPAFDIDRSVLDVAWTARQSANDLSIGQTPSTFLPLLAAARCAAETPQDAARAAAWFAVNDLVVAFDEMRGVLPSEAGVGPHVLAEHLVVTTAGLEATAAVLPHTAYRPVRRILTLAGRMTEALRSTDGDAVRDSRLDVLAAGARALRDRWPVPALLPTAPTANGQEMGRFTSGRR
ncbi:hypothetical protein AB1484_23235 [Parafrankia sp. FMc6]|uniref:hypothetical protein n=1 Tax=Parafrankia soli TaxID=2599596 RepID=UPI0034D42A24